MNIAVHSRSRENDVFPSNASLYCHKAAEHLAFEKGTGATGAVYQSPEPATDTSIGR
jgi:hypothetical protein